MSIGKEIKKARKDAKMSQQQLADKLECAQHEISQYENGKHLPSAKRLIKISEIFVKDWELVKK